MATKVYTVTVYSILDYDAISEVDNYAILQVARTFYIFCNLAPDAERLDNYGLRQSK